jgi:hypothetical protein
MVFRRHFFDNLSRIAPSCHPRGDPAKRKSRRAQGETLSARLVREKGVRLRQQAKLLSGAGALSLSLLAKGGMRREKEVAAWRKP